MDLYSLEEFKNEIKQIREYLKHIQYVNDLANYPNTKIKNEDLQKLMQQFQQHHKAFHTDKKLFEYKACIISLYGLLERTIEKWIREFLEEISTIVIDYQQLNENLKKNHFDLSIKLIHAMISRENNKFSYLTKETILKNLNDCTINPLNYTLNTEAFILLSGNLKHRKIAEILKQINIDINKGLMQNETFKEWIKEEIGNHDIERINPNALYNQINALVDRRNEVAHGVVGTYPILNESGLQPYIQFLEHYGEAIFHVLDEVIIEQETQHHYQEIEVVKGVWNNCILGFEAEDCTIRVGDMLIVETQKGRFLKKKILSIRVNDKEHKILNVKEKINVGIKVEPRIKENQTFYLKG